MEFEHMFDGTFTSFHVGYKKDNENYYQHIFKAFPEVKPEEMLLWDDDQQNVAKAKAMGMHAEFYTSFEDFQKKMESYLL
jgi:HAD superfamily hydrolase (TIGR01509 family)